MLNPQTSNYLNQATNRSNQVWWWPVWISLTTLVTVGLGAGIVGFAGLPAYSSVLSSFGVTVSLPSLLQRWCLSKTWQPSFVVIIATTLLVVLGPADLELNLAIRGWCPLCGDSSMYIKPLPSSNTKLACILFDKYRLIWTILLNYCRWHQFIQPSKTNKVYPIGLLTYFSNEGLGLSYS